MNAIALGKAEALKGCMDTHEELDKAEELAKTTCLDAAAVVKEAEECTCRACVVEEEVESVRVTSMPPC